MSLWADPPLASRPPSASAGAYRVGKRVFDLLLASALLPLLAAVLIAVWALNPRLNPGPLFYAQTRMGRDCRPFTLWKLRTMRPGAPPRGPEEPLEVERIPPFGRLLRRLRLDELPQVVNMLRGEMSFVGPRPDCLSHARAFLGSVPGYRARHAVRPGLTGLAQVRLGYAEGAEATREKVRVDLDYVAGAGWGTDLRIVLETVGVILACRGR